MAQWYYALGGQQNGPVETAVLRQLLSAGQVNYQDLVWQEGMANWIAAASVPELIGGITGAQPAYGQPLQYASAQSNPQPLGYGRAAPSHQSLATTALVLACLGILCFGPILAPTGLIMGIVARNNMKRDGNYEGSGQALAAIIVGSILICLYVVVIAVMIAISRH